MEHQATIDRPFSDELTLSPAERDAENAAFLSRVRAATHQVMPLPASDEASGLSWSCHLCCIVYAAESIANMNLMSHASHAGTWAARARPGGAQISQQG